MISLFLVVILGLCADVTISSECDSPNKLSCRNVFSAHRCGILDECLTHWKESKWVKYREDLSAECIFCKSVAPYTKTSALTPLLCGFSSLSSVGKDECRDWLLSLKDLGRNDSEGAGICNVLTICDSHVYLGDLNFDSTVCEDCKKIIEDVRSLVRDNATAEMLIDRFNSLVCNNLPDPIRDFCKENVKVHIPAILHAIDVHIDPQCVCSALNLCPRCNGTEVNEFLNPDVVINSRPQPTSDNEKCPKQNKFSWISRPTARNNPMWTSYNNLPSHISSDIPSCDQCQAVLDQIKHSMDTPEMRASLKKDVDEKICHRLGTLLRELCIRAVEENFDQIFGQLEDTDTREACHAFGMCPANKNCIPQQETAVTEKEDVSMPVLCPLCEMITAKLVDLIVHETTEEEVKDALNRVCTLLPSSLKPKCIDFVEKYGAKVVEALIKGLSPKFICIGLGVCDPLKNQLSFPLQPVRDGTCDTCKMLVQLAYNMLLQNKTEEELKHILKDACHRIHIYTEKCDEWVERYLPQILQFLEQQFTPEQVCKALGLCQITSSSSNQNFCLNGPSYWCLNTQTAAACRATEFCLATSWNQSMKIAPENVCERLSLDEICTSLELTDKCGKEKECLARQMQHYLTMITTVGEIDALSSGPTPSDVTANCSVCKHMINRWKLHRKLFGAPIADSDVCLTFVGDRERKQCKLVWERRYEIFERLVTDRSDAEEICKVMGLCQKESSKSSKLLASRAILLACADGPSYWCSSRRAAENCGTVNFCNALGWFGESGTVVAQNAKPAMQGGATDIFGQNVCDWGPTYYCQSRERAQECGEAAVRHCETRVWSATDEPVKEEIKPQHVEPLGKNPCTWGPAYWCSSAENAKSCGPRAVEHCRRLKSFKRSRGAQ
ncbi:unnamed protein product [Calicophoron daubneyi]|uniref:Prosaposin n=1 Tax=Calicophoron daubneyi TaxID=300641 RepID=A0AAV2SXX1_CALDB